MTSFIRPWVHWPTIVGCWAHKNSRWNQSNCHMTVSPYPYVSNFFNNELHQKNYSSLEWIRDYLVTFEKEIHSCWEILMWCQPWSDIGTRMYPTTDHGRPLPGRRPAPMVDWKVSNSKPISVITAWTIRGTSKLLQDKRCTISRRFIWYTIF